jgi:hypothetical protein
MNTAAISVHREDPELIRRFRIETTTMNAMLAP